MASSAPTIDWRAWFAYKPDGTLIWKVDRRSGNGKVQVYAGTIAGSTDANGYVCICLNRTKYKAHRIIWEMHFGKIPKGLQIDHINGERSDNRVENLRVVSHAENGRNQRKRRTNKTGKLGVQRLSRNGRISYQARWTDVEGYEKSKTFSEGKYENPFDEACKFRDKMIESLNQQGAGYHALHGNK